MMESRYTLFALSALGTAVLIASLAKLKTRLELSKAKHRSLAGHARMGKRIASLIPFYEYDEAQFFRADSAPDEAPRFAVVARIRPHAPRASAVCPASARASARASPLAEAMG